LIESGSVKPGWVQMSIPPSVQTGDVALVEVAAPALVERDDRRQ
jgi:hypothetical protein